MLDAVEWNNRRTRLLHLREGWCWGTLKLWCIIVEKGLIVPKGRGWLIERVSSWWYWEWSQGSWDDRKREHGLGREARLLGQQEMTSWECRWFNESPPREAVGLSREGDCDNMEKCLLWFSSPSGGGHTTLSLPGGSCDGQRGHSTQIDLICFYAVCQPLYCDTQFWRLFWTSVQTSIARANKLRRILQLVIGSKQQDWSQKPCTFSLLASWEVAGVKHTSTSSY